MNPHLIFLGAPGSGKGTQAFRLCENKKYAHFSTGDLLRKEINSSSELGKKVSSIIKKGKLVDDNIVLELLSIHFNELSAKAVFDGFPRNIEQAKALDETILKDSHSLAVYFDITLDLLVDRIINRVTCSSCGEIYNLKFKPLKVEGICDLCKSKKLIKREDDTKEVVEKRLEIFRQNNEPILDYYSKSNRLKKIDASQGEDEIYSALEEIFN